jgi:hypothetical protein
MLPVVSSTSCTSSSVRPACCWFAAARASSSSRCVNMTKSLPWFSVKRIAYGFQKSKLRLSSQMPAVSCPACGSTLTGRAGAVTCGAVAIPAPPGVALDADVGIGIDDGGAGGAGGGAGAADGALSRAAPDAGAASALGVEGIPGDDGASAIA